MFPSEDYWSAPRHSDLQRNQTLTCIALIPPLTHVWLPMEVSADTKIAGPVKVITECNQNALLWNRVMSLTGLTYLQHLKRYIRAVYVGFQASIIPSGLLIASFSTTEYLVRVFSVSDNMESTVSKRSLLSLDDCLHRVIHGHLRDQQILTLVYLLRQY